MQKVIGYETVVVDGKELQRAIYEDLGPAKSRPTSWAYADRQKNAAQYVLKKTEKMSKTRRQKYLNAITKKHFGIESFSEMKGMRISDKKVNSKKTVDIFEEEIEKDPRKIAWESWNSNRSVKITFEEYLQTFGECENE